MASPFCVSTACCLLVSVSLIGKSLGGVVLGFCSFFGCCCLVALILESSLFELRFGRSRFALQHDLDLCRCREIFGARTAAPCRSLRSKWGRVRVAVISFAVAAGERPREKLAVRFHVALTTLRLATAHLLLNISNTGGLLPTPGLPGAHHSRRLYYRIEKPANNPISLQRQNGEIGRPPPLVLILFAAHRSTSPLQLVASRCAIERLTPVSVARPPRTLTCSARSRPSRAARPTRNCHSSDLELIASPGRDARALGRTPRHRTSRHPPSSWLRYSLSSFPRPTRYWRCTLTSQRGSRIWKPNRRPWACRQHSRPTPSRDPARARPRLQCPRIFHHTASRPSRRLPPAARQRALHNPGQSGYRYSGRETRERGGRKGLLDAAPVVERRAVVVVPCDRA